MSGAFAEILPCQDILQEALLRLLATVPFPLWDGTTPDYTKIVNHCQSPAFHGSPSLRGSLSVPIE